MTLLDELWAYAVQIWVWIDLNTIKFVLASLIGALLVAAMLAVRSLGKRLSQSPIEWVRVIGRTIAAMRGWFMIALAAKLIAHFAHAPADLANSIGFVFTVASALQAALIARALILGAVELRAMAADPENSLDSALGLIRILVTVALFGVAAVLILSNIGVDATGLIAGLGIGGIAIGLAAQGIFADLFAALAILFDQPFRRGDFIRWEQTSGTVEAIGLKTTRIRTVSGELAIVANTVLLAKEMRNFARSEHSRVVQTIKLSPRTPADLVAAAPRAIEAAIVSIENARFVRSGMAGFGVTSLDLDFVYDILTTDAAAALGVRHNVNCAVLGLPIAAHLNTL